ncbi:flagellar biosynthetic protein FliQ, partial [Enterobacter hormaechei]
QAATQVNEMTMTFIPKILMIVGVGVLLGPWMMKIFIEYTRMLFASIPYAIG